jgi:hypothetical protein
MSDLFGWQSEYMAMVEDCEARVSDLNDWEKTFVQSMRTKFSSARFRPTDRQIETLEDIWQKVTA